MNEDIIRKMVQPYLKDNSITYAEFDHLFEMLSRREQYAVLEILDKNNIVLRTDEEDNDYSGETELSDDPDHADDQDFEILYDDCVFSDEAHHQDDKIWGDGHAGYLESRREIRLSNEILCVMIQQGNAQARQDLCIKNKGLVEKVAGNYSGLAGNDLAFDDLEQAGMMGMLTAAERFDPNLGYAFSTYAMWWIKQAVVREIYDHGFTIRVPVHMMEMIHKVNVLNRQLDMAGIDYRKRLEKIAVELDTTQESIEQCMAVQNCFLNTASLDAPVKDSEDTAVLELIPDETAMSVEEEVYCSLMKEKVTDALQILTDREQKVLELRFGLTDGSEWTLEEIGNAFGVTRERVRQIEQKAFRKIRQMDQNQNLSSFIN